MYSNTIGRLYRKNILQKVAKEKETRNGFQDKFHHLQNTKIRLEIVWLEYKEIIPIKNCGSKVYLYNVFWIEIYLKP